MLKLIAASVRALHECVCKPGIARGVLKRACILDVARGRMERYCVVCGGRYTPVCMRWALHVHAERCTHPHHVSDWDADCRRATCSWRGPCSCPGRGVHALGAPHEQSSVSLGGSMAPWHGPGVAVLSPSPALEQPPPMRLPHSRGCPAVLRCGYRAEGAAPTPSRSWLTPRGVSASGRPPRAAPASHCPQSSQECGEKLGTEPGLGPRSCSQPKR